MTISVDPAAGRSGRDSRSCWLRSAKAGSARWFRWKRRAWRGTVVIGIRLLEFCGLVGTLIVDEEAIYDPRSPNDRLLLGMKGTMSEMELSVFRQRSVEAMRQKARRGELHLTVAVGYVKTDDNRIEKDPDRRVQDGILLVFRKFAELQSIRQVLLWFRQENVLVPTIVQGRGKTPDRVEGASLPYATSRADEPGVRWLLRLRPARNTRDDRGRSEADHARQPPTRLEGMGGFDP